MSDEKRKFSRLEMTNKVDAASIKIVKAIDVSTSGIGLLIDNKLNISDIIPMEFLIPGNPIKFTVDAKIMWIKKEKNGYLTGLEFQKIKVIPPKGPEE